MKNVAAVAVLIFLAVAFAVSLLAKTKMVSRLENGIYAAQTRSALEDGDLNIVNQSPPEQRWLVSRTYNQPDFRENGAAALWLPFFAYGRLLPELELGPRPWGTPVTHEDVGQALATLSFALAAMVFSLWLMRLYMGKQKTWTVLALMTLGTPTLWYVFFEPYGTDMASGFVLAACVFLYLFLLRNRSLGSGWWLLLGAAASYGAAVKVYGVFYLFALGLQIFLRWVFEGRTKERALQALCFAGGALPVSALHVSNHYLKFGELGSQYWELQKFYSMFGGAQFLSSPLQIYFGPSGWAFASPIYLVAAAGAGLWILDRVRNTKSAGTSFRSLALSVRVLLVAVPLVIFLSTSFEMIDEHFGTARRFAAQQPMFLLALLYFLSRAGAGRAKEFIASAASAWGFLMIARYAANKDVWGDRYWVPVAEWPEYANRVIEPVASALSATPSVAAGLLGWFPAVILMAFALVHLRRSLTGASERRALFSAAPWIAFPVTIFIAISFLNLSLNRRNTERLRAEGFFSSTVVAGGMTAYIYDDLTSVIPKFKRLSEIRNDPALAADADRVARLYLAEVASKVESDPIGFKENCERGIMRPSHFEIFRP